MNILFTTKKISVGGVAVVSIELANNLIKLGHKVSLFAFMTEYDDISYVKIDPQIKVYFGGGMKNKKENIKILSTVINIEKCDIVINQWGLPFFNISCILNAIHNLHIPIISVYHNDPLSNSRLKDVEIAMEKTSNSLKKWFLKTKWNTFKAITSKSMRFVYNHSDLYMVLSPSYVEHFKKFTGIKNPTKLLVQTNPVTIDTSGFTFNPSNKQKEIIYVGRIDYNQKRVYRVIDTWNCLEERFPDWKLTIVGDGPERKNIEELVKEKGLKHVSFEGFQQPIEYYKRASLLILTSEYEGFPLVLAECMSFGVVPAVYGSYSAVYDIVEDGKDGIILPQDNAKGYNTEEMAKRIAEVMNSAKDLNSMAENAIEKSKEYNIDKIVKQWDNLFYNLKNQH